MKFKLLFAFLLISSLSQAQIYSANNFTLASLIDPEPGAGSKYSACWGWTQPGTNREYAIACSKNGTYWIDVTNPFSPTVSAYHAGTSSNGTWREVKSYGNYCYVVCDDGGSTGFQIFDMSTLPATVTLVSSNPALFRRGHAAWVDGNKLYVSGVTYSTGATSSMDVYSLATPSAPVLLRRLNQDYNFITYVHDAFIRNDTVFASAGYQGLHVFKFNTGTNTFTQLGSLTTYSFSGYNHASALTPDGKTLVFMDEVPASLPVKVADVTNLGNIQVLSTFNQFPQTTPHNPFMVSNRYCFGSAYKDGTQLYDISNPNAPFVAGHFDTYPQGGGNNNNWAGGAYSGNWGSFPFFPSRNVFALDMVNGVFMLRTHLYSHPDINLQGNLNDIPLGSIITSTSNNTNYGTVNIGNTLNKTFVIQNIGLDTLKVTSVNISGIGASEFSVSGLPAFPFTVTPNTGTLSFSIAFTPTATGSRTAQITLNNNDYNESAYTFVTEGNGFLVSTGIESFENSDFRFFVYPNPIKNTAEFNIPSETNIKDLQINIYDVTGKLVLIKESAELTLKENKVCSVILNELNNGMYIFNLMHQGKEIAGKKIIVSK
ncbi:MAG: choice-of-anchor B family protein [Sphingobacteriaceae bacterium]|nr:choice-of-anchor B family protein [Sphingobacteriaceae bacterium]